MPITPKNRRAARVLRSWLISSLLFSGAALGVSLVFAPAGGGQSAIPPWLVLAFPATVLGVFHLAWYFYKNEDN